MAELRRGFNSMWTATKGIHGWDYKYCCDVCLSNLTPCHCFADSCQFFVLWWRIHSGTILNVLQGIIQNVKLTCCVTCPEEELSMCSQLMQWECYELVIYGKMCTGVDNKVLRLQYKETSTYTFLEYWKPRLQKFIFHNYVAQFQWKQYKISLQTFLETSILFVVDFCRKLHFSRI
jgi:hypothetical protein